MLSHNQEAEREWMKEMEAFKAIQQEKARLKMQNEQLLKQKQRLAMEE